MFQHVGFADVGPKQYLESRFERIAEVEDPGRILNGQGIVVEGIKKTSSMRTKNS